MMIDLTSQESEAVTECARMCNETIPGLIRKIIIQEITFMKSTPNLIPKEYLFDMILPDGLTRHEEKQMVEHNFNKIRGILNLLPIKI